MTDAITFPFLGSVAPKAKKVGFEEKTKTLFNKITDILEEKIIRMKSSDAESIEQRLEEVKSTTVRSVLEMLAKDGEKHTSITGASEIQIIVANTRDEAVDESIRAEKIERNSFEYSGRNNHYYEGFFDNHAVGERIRNTSTVVLCLENITYRYGEGEKQNLEGVYKTAIHEILHIFGGFEDDKLRGDDRFHGLKEGMTELLTLEIYKKNYEKDFGDSKNVVFYERQMKIIQMLMDLTDSGSDKKLWLQAYFKDKKFETIKTRLRSMGYPEQDVTELTSAAVNSSIRADKRLYAIFENKVEELKQKKNQKLIHTENESSARTLPDKKENSLADMPNRNEEHYLNFDKLANEMKSRADCLRAIRDSYAKLPSGESAKIYVEAVWNFIKIEYGDRKDVGLNSCPSVETIYPLGDSQEQDRFYRLNPNAIYFDEKTNIIRVLPRNFNKNKEFNKGLLFAVVYQSSGIVEQMRKETEPAAQTLLWAVNEYALGELERKCGINYVGVNSSFDRLHTLGKLLVSVVGSEAAADALIKGDSRIVIEGLKKAFGKKSILVTKSDILFFDEAITHMTVALAAMKKYPKSEQTSQTAAIGKKITYGDFEKEFLADPYKATFNLVSGFFPNLNDEYRTWVASSILYFSHLNNSFDAATVALVSVSLGNSDELSIPRSDFYHPEKGAEGLNRVTPMFLNSIMAKNIMQKKPLFDSVETFEDLEKQYGGFSKRHPEKTTKSGIGYRYSSIFSDLSRNLKDIKRSYGESPSVFASDAKLRGKMENYIDKLCDEFSTKIYSNAYAKDGFAHTYDKYIERMLGEFVLGLEYSMHHAEFKPKSIETIDGIDYAELLNGIKTPLATKNQLQPIIAVDGMDLNSQIVEHTEVHAKLGLMVRPLYINALREFATSKANKEKLSKNTVLLDTGRYRTKETGTWMKNVIADTSVAHAFFDIAATGIESCGSRIFVSV